MLIILPFSIVLATPPATKAAPSGDVADAPQSIRLALSEAFGHRSYVLLVLGFFTCGFQLAFITAHLPAYLIDRGLSVQVGGWVLAVIGLFNIVGSLTAGWLGNRMPKRYLLAGFVFRARRVDCAVHCAAIVDNIGIDLRHLHRSRPGSRPCRRHRVWWH